MSAALELDDAEILAIEQAELEHNKRDADSAGLHDADETENLEDGPNKSRRKVKQWLTKFAMTLFTCAGQCPLDINAYLSSLYTPTPGSHDACSAKVEKSRGDTDSIQLHAWSPVTPSFSSAAALTPRALRLLPRHPLALRHRSLRLPKRALAKFGIFFLALAFALKRTPAPPRSDEVAKDSPPPRPCITSCDIQVLIRSSPRLPTRPRCSRCRTGCFAAATHP